MSQLNLIDWHHRFSQQAGWTKQVRTYLFKQVHLTDESKVLDVGCGTGVLNIELDMRDISQYGLDINIDHLKLAKDNSKKTHYSQGDANSLPYPDNEFDVAFCHFLLMWVKNPLQVLREMVRVTKPNGNVLALAEPDYGGRIDYPTDLSILGDWQTRSLKQQGANPMMGRELSGLFAKAGLDSIEIGVLGGQWSGKPDWSTWQTEWQVLESDFIRVSEESITNSIMDLKALDKNAYERGERILFVPTFYARGIV